MKLYTPIFIFLHICRVHGSFLICIGSSLKESFIDQVKVNSKWPNGQLKLVNSKTLCELIKMSIERREGFLGIFFGRVHFSKLSLDGGIKVVFMKSNKETARFLQDHSRWFCFLSRWSCDPGLWLKPDFLEVDGKCHLGYLREYICHLSHSQKIFNSWLFSRSLCSGDHFPFAYYVFEGW